MKLDRPLGEYTPLWISVGVTLFSGLVLTCLGIKYFTGLSNGALFASGAIWAALVARELLRKGGPNPTWTEELLLPLGIWIGGILFSYVDSKLHLSQIVEFLVGALITAVLALAVWGSLLSEAEGALSAEALFLVLGVSLAAIIMGGLLLVKIRSSKPMLILAYVIYGSVLIGNGLSDLAVLRGSGTVKISQKLMELQQDCLLVPRFCEALAKDAGMTVQEVFPWLTLEFCLIPITGLIVQSVIALRQRKKARLQRAASTR